MDGICFLRARVLLFFRNTCLHFMFYFGWAEKGLVPVVQLDVLARRSIWGSGHRWQSYFNDAMLLLGGEPYMIDNMFSFSFITLSTRTLRIRYFGFFGDPYIGRSRFCALVWRPGI
ncbi:hypothetical protein B0H63DRAFT_237941 [Podospora didyma]|uniref:Uncharacterized protein n=1 Tax=Podospora didyma TaxID=330526 RepID=A0AAE0KKF2_9PEZI|nr:hypothetical protein B0H63DRAFT_237941 [Podospora didyma]